MTFNLDNGVDGTGKPGRIRKLTCEWTSDGSGNASGTSPKVAGRLIRGVTDPGSTAPSDNYDISITDESGADVLAVCQSGLSNRDTTNSEQVYFLVLDAAAGTPLAQSIHPVVCGQLTVTIANAGDTKSGVLCLYLET